MFLNHKCIAHMFFNFKPIANLKNLHIAFLAMLCFFTVGCSSTGNHANNDIAGIFDDISDDNSDNNSDKARCSKRLKSEIRLYLGRVECVLDDLGFI